MVIILKRQRRILRYLGCLELLLRLIEWCDSGVVALIIILLGQSYHALGCRFAQSKRDVLDTQEKANQMLWISLGEAVWAHLKTRGLLKKLKVGILLVSIAILKHIERKLEVLNDFLEIYEVELLSVWIIKQVKYLGPIRPRADRIADNMAQNDTIANVLGQR